LSLESDDNDDTDECKQHLSDVSQQKVFYKEEVKFEPSMEIVLVMSSTSTSRSLITKTTDNSKDLMFMIYEDNTINFNINLEQTIAKKEVRLGYLTKTTKSETKIPINHKH